MSKKLFSAEEIEYLRANKRVVKVTERTVDFTPEFKKELYDGITSGKSLRKLLTEVGLDPVMLGESRVNGLRDRLYRFGEREEGFQRKESTKPSEEALLRKRILQLEHDLAYTRQEVEFLKKTQMADMEARKQWESKHRRK